MTNLSTILSLLVMLQIPIVVKKINKQAMLSCLSFHGV